MACKDVASFTMKTQRPFFNLCWAAAALSVDLWHNLGRNQLPQWTSLCQVVQDTPPQQPGCCPNMSLPGCDHTGDVVVALQVHGLVTGSRNPPVLSNPRSVDFKWNSVIKHEIDNNRVVSASISWAGGGGHEVVIWGYCEDKTGRTVKVLDPWFDPFPDQSFTDFLTNYRSVGGRCIEFNMVS